MSGLRSNPPPHWLLDHVTNPALRFLVGTPLGRLLPSVAVLRFTGRRTGRTLRVPVMVLDVPGGPTVFTDGRWRANFRDGAPVTVTRAGKTIQGYGETLPDQQAADALRAALKLTPPKYLSLEVEPGYVPTDVELAAIRTAIRLRLDGEPAG
ncbi:MAG TPA: hypothetical protein VFE14_15050 [Micromonosporaceae bacterium]|jgi:hypothetical protein|nr:hypothetical protein [Micromonosporaceae bacterium]